MKVFGWCILVLGILSFMGNISAGNGVLGPSFFIALGAYLLHRANQKAKQKEEKDQWSKK